MIVIIFEDLVFIVKVFKVILFDKQFTAQALFATCLSCTVNYIINNRQFQCIIKVNTRLIFIIQYFGTIVKINIKFIFNIWFKNNIFCTVIIYTNNFIFTASTFYNFFSFEAYFLNFDEVLFRFGLSFATISGFFYQFFL